MRLAALLGCTVSELLDRTSSRELTEWMTYDATQGLPDRRQEILLASLLALTANVNRDPKKQRDAYRPEDFMPWIEAEDDEDAEPVDMARRIEILNAALGGVDLRGDASAASLRDRVTR